MSNLPQESTGGFDEYWNVRLESLADSDLLRQLPRSNVDGRIDFSSNDYLGLSRHPRTLEAACRATKEWGTGSRAARLLAGRLTLFENLERQIAADKKMESALIYSSGYQANFGVLRTILDSRLLGHVPRVFLDRLNHESILSGCLATKARIHRYRHLDMEHLGQLLEKYASCDRAKFIISETVFGMDGDIADVAALSRYAQQYGAFLYLDEAHATGVAGQHGWGLSGIACQTTGNTPDLVMGTFSKAIGSSGAYVSCSNSLKQLLVNRCGSFIYSTAPVPAAIGAAAAAWELLPEMEFERQRIKLMARRIIAAIGNNELEISNTDTNTNIVPVVVGSASVATQVAQQLLQQQVIVSAIRPPTVPDGTARLRISVSANHDDNDLATLLRHLVPLLKGETS